MSDITKVGVSHLSRAAYVYLRQSSPAQVEHNRESTQRQYALASKATTLGWPQQQVVVIDDDLGLSGSGIVERSGFARLTAEVALGHVGIVLGLEVSRLARNNADWYRLLDLCGLTDTLIGDADGIYHPALFNDRLLLGLKGTMSEAELHILRARLLGGIRNKAARGELRRGLPVGFVWGEEDGEVRFHPDEAVCTAIRTVFARFSELGSARRVWLWFRSEGLSFPLQTRYGGSIRWVDPSYIAIYHVLTNPVYAGAYAYGKSRHEVTLDLSGARKKRVRKLPQSQWSVLIPSHHQGFIDWSTYEANRVRISSNTHPRPHQSGSGAVREGTALLQGLAVCGQCGRKLRTHYTGRTASPGYHCAGKTITNGRGIYCLNIGAVRIDDAVAQAVLAALAPLGIEVALVAAERIEADHDGALTQWRLAVERASYQAQRAERHYRAVDPDNRLVARGLEAEWEKALRELETAKAELARREQLRPRTLNNDERSRLLALGSDLRKVWQASTTAARDKKELLRTLIEEVIITVNKDQYRSHLTLRWRGGALAEIDLDLPRRRAATVRTDEDTVGLMRRLAIHYPDAVIAGILNRQQRTTAYGHRFTAHHVGSLRRHWNIARYEPPATPPEGEVVTIKQLAATLDVATSTIHRWLNDGIIAGEQLTLGAPWRIRLTDDLRARVAEDAPEGYLTMYQIMRRLGVSRQTVWQRVKRGDIEAIHVRRGRKKGLRLKLKCSQPDLFNQAS
ncbi:MAG TPA: recombinase family protein [Candidatus Acidoferrales bacterium]|nr:recombinase family protein [Candidatus Acidoferrales bacterium]